MAGRIAYYGGIVRDGLVLYLDAAKKDSYPGSGTVWRDIVGANNGTLTNGPTFSSANGGSIVFDGVDDFVNLPINAQFNTPSVTFDCWVNLQDRGNRHIVYVNWVGNSLEVNSNRTVVMYNLSSASQQGATTTSTINFGEWVNITGIYNDINQTLETYINAVLRATRTSTPNTLYNVSTHRISGTNFGGAILGNVSIVRHYNRALSAQEVLQNYNATKTRFGL